jgi:NAD(P)-dependent dehydrogenase (short-subunit alcohol dehydrogenase family)
VIIITGASRGIGAVTARLAGAKGFSVCINHRDSAAEAERVAADIAAGRGQTIVVQADVSREEEVMRLFETTDRELGRVTALVNNAGVTGPAGRRIADVDSQTLHTVFNTNVIGSILCAREAIRRMSTRHDGHGGHIVNLSSTATRMGSRLESGHRCLHSRACARGRRGWHSRERSGAGSGRHRAARTSWRTRSRIPLPSAKLFCG